MQILSEHRNGQRIERKQTKHIEQVCGVRCSQIADPTKKRRMQLDGDVQYFVPREKYQELNQEWQAARRRCDIFTFVELQDVPIGLLRIFGSLANSGDLRLKMLHLDHRAIRPVGERDEDEL